MKKEDLSKEYIEDILETLKNNGISYNTEFCDRKHSYVLHCWIEEEYKVNLFLRTLRFVPFGLHKGISGEGIAELKRFLVNAADILNKEREYTYKEKYEAMKDALLAVRNETNCDFIDEIIKEYC